MNSRAQRKLISAFGVGIDGVDINLTKVNQIRVTNTSSFLSDDVADIALTLILIITRNVINAEKQARSCLRRKKPMPCGFGLAGKKLGIWLD